MIAHLRRTLPGIAILVGLGLAARAIATVIPVGSPLIPAILLGVVVGNAGTIPTWAGRGIAVHKLFLEAGIILMGSRVAFEALVEAGPRVIVIVLLMIPVTILIVEILGRVLFGVPAEMGSLLAAGAGICGVSAVVATAGAIDAKKEYITYTVATVLLFDVLTLVSFPLLGELLGLSSVEFGVWAGVSMYSTGPVAAAGFAFSEAAGRWAMITKLTRNAFIGIAVVLYSVAYTRANTTKAGVSRLQTVWEKFPKFVFGFVGVVILVNSGVFSAAQILALEHSYRWLFLFAFVGLGMELNLTRMRDTGVKPIIVVLLSLVATSVVSLLFVRGFL